MNKILKYILIAFIIPIIGIITFVGILFLGGFGKIPSEAELLNIKNESASLVYSQDGYLIGKYFTKNRTNVTYDSLPNHLIEALIATEDARFYEHEGVDGIAFLRVLFKSILLQDRSSGGGSTLSQQLAKNLFGRKDYGKISIGVNKLKEIILANRLENIYEKDEIIELYLNTVPFGENVYGIEVASLRYFSKHVSQLRIEEAAVLIGILKANTKYNPKKNPQNAIERRSIVLTQMRNYNYIYNNDLDSLKKLPLGLKYSNISKESLAPYFIKYITKELRSILNDIENHNGAKYDIEKDGLTIETTLNSTLQIAAKDAMNLHLSKMQKQLNKLYSYGSSKRRIEILADKIAKREKIDLSKTNKEERLLYYYESDLTNKELSLKDSLIHTLRQLHAGILGINPNNGAVLNWVGGIDYKFYPFDQILAKRQMASTFKPILYAEAIRKGRDVCDYLSNESIELSDYDNWSPSNYDKSEGGNYSLAAALAYSKNIPTVHLYFETEIEELNSLWNDLGFIDKLNEGPSVILGTNSVNALELAVAYSVFANGGKMIYPYSIERIKNQNGDIIYERSSIKSERVLEENTARSINGVLKKAINEGTGIAIRNKYNLQIPFAGKTGTSQNYADAWFVGYNSNLVMVSRVGASYPSIHFSSGYNGSGSSLALPLVGLTLKESLNDVYLKDYLYSGKLKSIGVIECEDYKEGDLIDQLFNVFKKKDSNLENEKNRAKKKKKVKGLFKKIFGN